MDMGDLTFLVPAATTTTPAAAAAPEPTAAGHAAHATPLCRRVHFRDFPSSAFWFPPATDNAMAEKAEPPENETAVAAGELEEHRMDLLWEDFNEELLAMRRAGAGSCSSESSDGEESDSAAGRTPAGCFPVLRPSARAGGAGHYRRRAGTWVLLMRIFKRLFVIDKTISGRRHAPAPRGEARPCTATE